MYYELPVNDFIQLLLTYIRERKTGMVFFFADSTNWGKLVIDRGDVLSVRFKTLKGHEALPSIKGLKKIQYYFRPEDPSHLISARDGDVTAPSFFAFFGIDLAQAKQKGQTDDERIAVSSAAAPPPRHSPRKHAKILIADDSGIARKALSRVLLDSGFDVIEARDGFETLGQLENEKPDLLFLDLVMPGIDGYKVLKMIERSQNPRHIPIIVLTSRDGLLDKMKGMMLSCDAYLTKPVAPDALLEMVAKFLPPA